MGYWVRLYNILPLRFYYTRKIAIWRLWSTEDYVKKLLWVFLHFNFMRQVERVKCHKESHHWREKKNFLTWFLQKHSNPRVFVKSSVSQLVYRCSYPRKHESEKFPFGASCTKYYDSFSREKQTKKTQLLLPRTHWSNGEKIYANK